MKLTFLVILFNISILNLFSQTLIDFGKFPSKECDSLPLLTENLLQRINWETIKKYCDTSKSHHADTYKDSLITIYEYVEQGYVSHFLIKSYKGFVLQYESEITNTSQPSSSSYFDKNIWMHYVNDLLPELPATFRLTTEESPDILKSYYQLLGVNSRDEYGWICEYSATGRPPDKRLAVIDLIKDRRIDLLRKLLSYSNVQTQLYATDALIYIDFETKKRIETNQTKLNQQQEKIDSLNDLNSSKNYEIESAKRAIANLNGSIKYQENFLLTKKEWQGIYEFRDSKQIIKICGNTGSYKVYQTSTLELLSETAIAEIVKNYEEIKKLGYF